MTVPSFKESSLEQVCNILGDTGSGLTGSQIGKYLRICGIADPNPGITKRVRLFEALSVRQRQDRCANNVCAFIERVMDPVLHVEMPGYFKSKQGELNSVLAFEGLRLSDTGKLETAKVASTISEAQTAANTLRHKLTERGVHPDVLKFCRAELVEGNYFHAVLEIVFQRITPSILKFAHRTIRSSTQKSVVRQRCFSA